MKIKMNERTGEFLVAFSTACRGSSLLFSKLAMKSMGPFMLMAWRFLIAFVILGVIFHKYLPKITKKELIHCVLLGFLFFLAMGFELIGLRTTDSSVTAFLEGVDIIMVAAIVSVIGRRLPDRETVISALIAIVGVGMLTLRGGSIGFTIGELIVIFGTFWYSLSVVVTDNAAKNDDPIVVAVYQLLFIGLWALLGAFLFEDFRVPQSGMEWSAVLALTIICSVIGFTFQVIGQRYTTPERAGILMVFSPLTAAVLGVTILHEELTLGLVAGGILIIASTLAPMWLGKLLPEKKGE